MAFALPGVPLWELELEADPPGWRNSGSYTLVKSADGETLGLVRTKPPCELRLLDPMTGSELTRMPLAGERLGVARERSRLELRRGLLLLHYTPILETGRRSQALPEEARVYDLKDGRPLWEIRQSPEFGESISALLFPDRRSVCYVRHSRRPTADGKFEERRSTLERKLLEPEAKVEVLAEFSGFLWLGEFLDERTLTLSLSRFPEWVDTVLAFDAERRAIVREWPDRVQAGPAVGDFLLLDSPWYWRQWKGEETPAVLERANWRTGEVEPCSPSPGEDPRRQRPDGSIRDPATGSLRYLQQRDEQYEQSWGFIGTWIERLFGWRPPRRHVIRSTLEELDDQGERLRLVGSLEGSQPEAPKIIRTTFITLCRTPATNEQRLVAWRLLAPTRPWGKALLGGAAAGALVLALTALARRRWGCRPEAAAA